MFISANKIISFFLLVIILIFLFIINSGFINYFINLTYKQYLVQTAPKLLFNVINHKYFKYYLFMGLVLNVI